MELSKKAAASNKHWVVISKLSSCILDVWSMAPEHIGL